MQIEGTKLIFVMNFSVLDFFKFVSRMPQIAQVLVSTFKTFREGKRGEGGNAPDLLEISSVFLLAIPGSVLSLLHLDCSCCVQIIFLLK